MELRDRLQRALLPLISELRARLARLPTLAVLNHYQLRIYASLHDKSKCPDAFIFKWRFLWALLLSSAVSEGSNQDPEFEPIDDLVEKIFDVYEVGALYEPGRFRGSEREFLTRLGLAIRVREPELLGFPEQIKDWASVRLRPFDDSYFLPSFGLRFGDIVAWIENLSAVSADRLDKCLTDYAAIMADLERLRGEFVRGELEIEPARNAASGLRIGDRLGDNGKQREAIQIFSADDLQRGISQPAVQALTKLFAAQPGEVGREYAFPHDENPLEYRLFAALPEGTYYFLDPASAYRIVAKTFEREILTDERLRGRYLRNRDRATESWVTASVRRVFPSAAVHPNYYLEKGRHEKDLFVQEGETVILIECKNSKVRTFKGTASDLLNYERDFGHSVQLGYEQANQVKQRILGCQETTFFDEKGQSYFSVKRSEIKKIYILCVTITPRGPLGTDLSYELKKSGEEPFPLAVNLFDFDTICKHFRSEQFIEYIRARERLHGRVRTGDELNYAGYFLKYGNLRFEGRTRVGDDFSAIFDRMWLKEKGIEVEEPTNPPSLTTMRRKGNRVTIDHGTGRREEIRVPPELIERVSGKPMIHMKGSERNKPCPCGSGRKLKRCCGIG